MSTIKDILNGWTNYLHIKGHKTLVLEEAKKRAKICVDCPHIRYGKHAAVLPEAQIGEIQGHYCNDCKCPISVKVRSVNDTCPLGKW
ncbi:hypothetical protein [Aegicerativicinus sediminis]|uniref:hypothetical protein n=1 Tax=Aegicerativicinus sediminis TaxID=2893202 RepID=UPI001E3A3C30|nr:hypothetical protein [Aegicerativicinus sediminis]